MGRRLWQWGRSHGHGTRRNLSRSVDVAPGRAARTRHVCFLGALLPLGISASCVITLNTGTSADGGAQDTTPIDSSPDIPTPTGDWVDVTANLANMSSACGNLSNLSAKPDE